MGVKTLKVATKQASVVRITEAKASSGIRRDELRQSKNAMNLGLGQNTTFFLRGAELIGTICKVDKCFFECFFPGNEKSRWGELDVREEEERD